MIFNGAKVDPTIISLLPKYAVNHYFYLKSKVPDCVPTIKVFLQIFFLVKWIEFYFVCYLKYLDDDSNINDNVESDQKQNKANDFYRNILENLEQAEHIAEESIRLKLYSDNSNNLDHLARIEPEFSPSCEIMYTYIKCLLIIRQHLMEPNLVKLEEVISLNGSYFRACSIRTTLMIFFYFFILTRISEKGHLT